jgi:hypothetical protein
MDSYVAVFAENDLIGIFFVFSAVADSTSGIFLHGLVPYLSVDSFFPLIIEEFGSIMLSLF